MVSSDRPFNLMLKTIIFIGAASLSSVFGVTILNQADWDGIDDLNDGNNGASVTEVVGVGAPAGSNGAVAAIDLSGGNVWGAVNPPSNTILLPSGSVPGTDTFEASLRVFVPSSTTLTGTDRISLIVRSNNVNAGNTNTQRVWNTITPDTWTTISIPATTIPELDNGGNPVTGLTPIISFFDRTDAGNAEAGAGVAAYIDDWSFSVTTSVPEPSTSVAGLAALGLLGLRRKR